MSRIATPSNVAEMDGILLDVSGWVRELAAGSRAAPYASRLSQRCHLRLGPRLDEVWSRPGDASKWTEAYDDAVASKTRHVLAVAPPPREGDRQDGRVDLALWFLGSDELSDADVFFGLAHAFAVASVVERSGSSTLGDAARAERTVRTTRAALPTPASLLSALQEKGWDTRHTFVEDGRGRVSLIP